MPVSSTFRRNARTSSGGSGRARHWPADLVKICSVSHPCSAARSTARGTPPPMDIWAPILGMHTHYRRRNGGPHRTCVSYLCLTSAEWKGAGTKAERDGSHVSARPSHVQPRAPVPSDWRDQGASAGGGDGPRPYDYGEYRQTGALAASAHRWPLG